MARTKMSREDRAKQFMPFAALRGYEDALREREKIVVEKIELSDGELVCLAFLSRLGGVEFSFDFGGSLAPQFPHTGALS